MNTKLATYILAAVLLVTLGASAFFFLNVHQPLAEEIGKLQGGMAEFEKVKTELKKMKESDKRETAWLKPAEDALAAALNEVVAAGHAEVFIAGNRIVVNITDDTLYAAGSTSLTKTGQELIGVVASQLKKAELKGRAFTIANSAEGVEAQGKGKKKTAAKDGRTIAGERSMAIVKELASNGVEDIMLVAAAYPSQATETGFKLKAKKTMLVIEAPMQLQAPTPKTEAAPKAPADAHPAASAATTTAAHEQPAAAPHAAAGEPAHSQPVPIKPAHK